MQRTSKIIESITVSDAVGDCSTVAKRMLAGGSIQLPASTTIGTLTLYTTHDDGVTWGPCYDQDGVPVTLTVTSGASPVFVELPAAAYAFPVLRFVSDSATDETATVYLVS